ncbi:uncharacterized protein DUF4956 [Natranaerovirga hydrolytica]|uniref:Uncharacterized protein DUF4956 n=1 Tax=Natranaerovirga hydrolytica TaxID=680378 RepID=A0A4R1ML88_9FIRM|nr:DUF4956 domain-containing protein [Natranaerovirga hydrolytica]TCK90593.1 uncharacterized protein DUF4956 [Natranaerovirga hydrolytica]
MFESIFNTTTQNASISIEIALLTLVISFVLGIIISIIYMKTCEKGSYSKNFAITLIIVPTVMAIIIFLIGTNIATAFSLAGVFSMIRFRSAPGDPKDIAYVLFTMAAGLACGLGVFSYAIMFTLLLCLFMLLLDKMHFGNKNMSNKLLKITIPEDMDYEGRFDEILQQYTSEYELRKIRTMDLGTLYELIYDITIEGNINQKEFIDALRCRNGNLNIALSMGVRFVEY